MDIEDFFEKKKKYNTKYEKPYNSNNGGHHHQNYAPFIGSLNISKLIKSIVTNKKLKTILLVGVIGFILVIIAIIALLFPLISNIFNYITENGVSGLYYEILVFLNNTWNGTK